MKILYISNVFPSPDQNSTIYTDLAEEINQTGNEIVVVASDGNNSFKETRFKDERGFKVLRVKTGQMYNVGLIKKGLAVITLKFFLIKAIRKYLKGKKFDLILFETPPITSIDVIEWSMKYFDCPSYLMLKDIFPQNAVDIGLIKKDGLIYKYFKNKEKKLYFIATVIGCMSEANRQYILRQNRGIDENKVEIFPNTKKIKAVKSTVINYKTRKKYNIPIDRTVAIYGGNMGKPQGIDFFMEIIKSNKENMNIFFVLVGRGTERRAIKDFISEENILNAKLFDMLPRDEYEKLEMESDIGLIFLNKRFTIPNFPSRILSYFENGIPVIAATDINTDFGKMIDESGAGFWSVSGNIEEFNRNLKILINDKIKRKILGLNGHKYLVDNFSVSKSVQLLEVFYNQYC